VTRMYILGPENLPPFIHFSIVFLTGMYGKEAVTCSTSFKKERKTVVQRPSR